MTNFGRALVRFKSEVKTKVKIILEKSNINRHTAEKKMSPESISLWTEQRRASLIKCTTHLPFIIFHSIVTKRHHVLWHSEREPGADHQTSTHTELLLIKAF